MSVVNWLVWGRCNTADWIQSVCRVAGATGHHGTERGNPRHPTFEASHERHPNCLCVGRNIQLGSFLSMRLVKCRHVLQELRWKFLFWATIVGSRTFRSSRMEELVLVMSCHAREPRRNDICVFQHNIPKYTFGHISCIGRRRWVDGGSCDD